MTINPHIAILHHSIKFYRHQFLLIARRQGKLLPIPSHAARQKRSRPTRQIGRRKRTFNAPVVRQINYAPSRIIIARLLRAGDVTFGEMPMRVEIFHIRRRCYSGKECQQSPDEKKAQFERRGCPYIPRARLALMFATPSKAAQVRRTPRRWRD